METMNIETFLKHVDLKLLDQQIVVLSGLPAANHKEFMAIEGLLNFLCDLSHILEQKNTTKE